MVYLKHGAAAEEKKDKEAAARNYGVAVEILAEVVRLDPRYVRALVQLGEARLPPVAACRGPGAPGKDKRRGHGNEHCGVAFGG